MIMSPDARRAAVLAALDAGRALNAGAKLSSVRLPNPADPDSGIVVHLLGDEQGELTEALRAILLRRIERAAAPPAPPPTGN